jgi:hypothetical protein
MLTDKQKEALKAVLELHREKMMTDEQVLIVIEALTENAPTLQYIPCPNPSYPWITYGNNINPDAQRFAEAACNQELK